MKKQEDYYITEPLIKRSTVLSLDDYLKFIEKLNSISIDDVNMFIENKYIEKAIFIASPSLYYAIKNHSEDEKKIINGFIKYYIRMCTRATPYGLFSYSSIINNTNLKSEYHAEIRIDDEWLACVIKKLIRNDDVFNHLSVKVNNSIFVQNERIKIYYNSPYSDNNNGHIMIKKTNLIDLIYNYCKDEFVQISELYSNIIKISDSSISAYKIYSFIRSLVYKGFLISNLELNLSGDDRLKQIIKVLDSFDFPNLYTYKLKKISAYIKRVNKGDFDENIDYLKAVYDEMKTIESDAHFFDCVLIKNNEKAQINIEKYSYVPELLTYLNNISTNSNRYCFRNYANHFLEKYGRNREIPLLKMIDSTGLGIPEADIRAENNLGIIGAEYLQKVNKAIENALYSNELTIRLEEFDIEKKDTLSPLSYCNSIELFFEEGFNGDTILDNSNVYFGPQIGSLAQGNTIGRFLSSCNESTKIKYKDKLKQNFLEYKKKGIEFVELYYRTSNAETFNLVSQEPITDRICCVGVNSDRKNLNLDDIVVGINRDERLYFKDVKSGNIIRFITISNLNPHVMPSLYSFLIENSYFENVIDILIQILNVVKSHSIQPRVLFHNIVISPVRIIFKKSDFNNEDVTCESLKKKIRKYINARYLYLVYSDNRLLIDTENDYCLNLVVREINNNKNVILSEIESFLDESLKNGNANIKMGELVITYKSIHDNDVFEKSHLIKESAKKRIFNISDEWITINVYCDQRIQQYLLVNHIAPLVQHLNIEHIINKFFYIRYQDSEHHIRLRFNIDLSDISNYYKVIKLLANDLNNSELVNKMTINEYVRETERYGGDNVIDDYERWFMNNSIISLSILKDNYGSDEELEIEFLLFAIKLLDCSEIEIDKIINIFKKYKDKKYYRTYRGIKRKLENEYINVLNEKSKYTTLLNQHINSTKEYFHKVNQEEIDKNMYLEIVCSCLHMFCNRVFGIDKFKEIQLYAYLYIFYEGKKYIEKLVLREYVYEKE